MKVKIIDYDHLGRGIAKINGKVVFIPKVKKGMEVEIEIVEHKKTYDIGRSLESKIESPVFVNTILFVVGVIATFILFRTVNF